MGSCRVKEVQSPEDWVKECAANLPGFRRFGELLNIIFNPAVTRLIIHEKQAEHTYHWKSGDNVAYAGCVVDQKEDVWFAEYDPKIMVTVLTLFGPVHGSRTNLYSANPLDFQPYTAPFISILHRAWMLHNRTWDRKEIVCAANLIGKDISAFVKANKELYLKQPEERSKDKLDYGTFARLCRHDQFLLSGPEMDGERTNPTHAGWMIHNHRLQLLGEHTGQPEDPDPQWGRVTKTVLPLQNIHFKGERRDIPSLNRTIIDDSDEKVAHFPTGMREKAIRRFDWRGFLAVKRENKFEGYRKANEGLDYLFTREAKQKRVTMDWHTRRKAFEEEEANSKKRARLA